MAATSPLRLSVLDQSPISRGMTAGDALRNSVDLARAAAGEVRELDHGEPRPEPTPTVSSFSSR